MIRLNMNKTKFLRLLEEKTRETPWAELPEKPQETRFWKVKRQWDYFLEWRTDRYFFRAFLASVVGKPRLSLEAIDEGHTVHRQVWNLNTEQLLADDMAVDTEDGVVSMSNTEQEQFKARFARIAAKLKGG